MNIPEIFVYNINTTLLFSVIIICLAAMGTLTKIFGKKPKPEELPGSSPYCAQHKENIERIEETTEKNTKKHECLKEIVNGLETQVGILKNQSDNIVKNMDEVKQSNKDIAAKLDDLLKQLLDWMSE